MYGRDKQLDSIDRWRAFKSNRHSKRQENWLIANETNRQSPELVEEYRER